MRRLLILLLVVYSASFASSSGTLDARPAQQDASQSAVHASHEAMAPGANPALLLAIDGATAGVDLIVSV